MYNNKSNKILIIAQPAFVQGLKNITSDISQYEFDVLPFDSPQWKKIIIFQKIALVKNYDLIHFFRGRTKLFHFICFRIFSRTEIVNNFIGSDLYRILKKKTRSFKLKICSFFSYTVANGHILHKELNELKIDNQILNFTNYHLKKTIYDFPNEKRAIAYLPSDKKNFYKHHFHLQLAKDFPEVEFTWFPYRKSVTEKLPTNINCIDYIPSDELMNEIGKNKVFLRFTEHDGLPNTLLEALLLGRWAIWTFSFRGVETITDYITLKNVFERLIKKSEPNYEGEKYVLEKYSEKIIKKKFEEYYTSILEGKK